MKRKQTKLLLAGVFFLLTTLLTPLFTPAQASALTTAQKKECYERWAGRGNGEVGGADFNEDRFRRSECTANKPGTCDQDGGLVDGCTTSTGGACRIVRYSDGAVIWCKRSDGEFGNGTEPWKVVVEPDDPDTNPDSDIPSNTDPAAGANAPCTQTNCPLINKYLNPAIALLSALVGIAVVIAIVWGGITVATSAGDPQKAAAGKNHIRNAIIGLVAFIFLYAFLKWLVPGGDL